MLIAYLKYCYNLVCIKNICYPSFKLLKMFISVWVCTETTVCLGQCLWRRILHWQVRRFPHTLCSFVCGLKKKKRLIGWWAQHYKHLNCSPLLTILLVPDLKPYKQILENTCYLVPPSHKYPVLQVFNLLVSKIKACQRIPLQSIASKQQDTSVLQDRRCSVTSV